MSPIYWNAVQTNGVKSKRATISCIINFVKAHARRVKELSNCLNPVFLVSACPVNVGLVASGLVYLAGRVPDAGKTACQDCLAGKVPAADHISCSDCPAGEVALAGAASCTACSAGCHPYYMGLCVLCLNVKILGDS